MKVLKRIGSIALGLGLAFGITNAGVFAAIDAIDATPITYGADAIRSGTQIIVRAKTSVDSTEDWAIGFNGSVSMTHPLVNPKGVTLAKSDVVKSGEVYQERSQSMPGGATVKGNIQHTWSFNGVTHNRVSRINTTL